MKFSFPKLVLLLMCGALLSLSAACSDDDPPAKPSTPTSVASGSVDNTGGTISVTSGAMTGTSIKVPAGALAQSQMIEIASGTAVVRAGLEMAVGVTAKFTPEGLTFAMPVEITLPYDVTSIPVGYTEADIVVLKRNDVTNAITILTPIAGGIDTVNKRVTVLTDSFSTFGPSIELNLPPVANNDTFSMTQGGSALINVLSNDTDPEGQMLSITAVGTNANGQVVIEGNQVRFTPLPAFFGQTSFTYTISDPRGATATATVSLQVMESMTEMPEVPVMSVSPLSVEPGEEVSIALTIASSLTVNSIVLNATPIGGGAAVTLNSVGANTYTTTLAVGTSISSGTYGLAFTLTHSGTQTVSGLAFVTVDDGVGTPDFEMTVLHNNDGESKLLNAGSGLEDFGGVSRFVTKARQLRESNEAEGRAVVTLSSGDNFLAGPAFNASLLKGIPYYDSIAMSMVNYDAVCIGNHDFDFGPDVLANFIKGFSDHAPFLSANLDYSGEPALQALLNQGRIAPAITITKNGQKIGIIGATTPQIPFISSPRNVVVNADIANVVQNRINAMMAAGVNKIILISHLQNINEDLALANQLQGVDIMIAGGGDELLANASDVLVTGEIANPAMPYPMTANDMNGNTVYVVTTPGDYKYLGQLRVTFDKAGNVMSVDGGSGPKRVAGGNHDDAVVADVVVETSVHLPVANAVEALSLNVIAQSTVALDGRRSSVRTREANEGNLIADALLWQAQQKAATFGITSPSVAIQNGGGIRNNTLVAAGDYTELDTYDACPFGNFVSVVENVSPAAFKLIMENCVSGWPGENGRFGQIAGFRMLFDGSGDALEINDVTGQITQQGSRVLELQLDDGTWIVQNGQVVQGAPTIALSTNDFSARGGDEYPFRNYDGNGNPIAGSEFDFTTVGVVYQQALFNYITADTSIGGLGGMITGADYPENGEGRISLQVIAPAIHTIQGSGHTSPLIGATVVGVRGIITQIDIDHFYYDENDNAQGGPAVYIQAEPGTEDTNDATSEGLLLHFSSDATVTNAGWAIGDLVEVSGTVEEWVQFTFGADTGAASVTRLENPTVNVVSNGNSLPAPVLLGTGGRAIPNMVIDDDGLSSFDIATDGMDFWESLEGMLVSFVNAQAVGGEKNGEVPCIIENGTYTNNTLSPDGSILIDDANNDFNPELVTLDLARHTGFSTTFLNSKVRARFPGTLQGTVDYTFGIYKVKVAGHILSSVIDNSMAADPMTTEVATIQGDSQNVSIASYNLENLRVTSFNPDFKIQNITRSIVNNLLEPDIIAVQEIQSDSASTTASTNTIAQLLAHIANEGATVNYAYVDISPIQDAEGGAPGGNIRNGYLYNPARVALVAGTAGDSTTATQVMNNAGTVAFSHNPGRVYPNHPAFVEDNSTGYKNVRRSLMAHFEFLPTGERLVLVNSHLGSKSEDDSLWSRTQPPFERTAEQRVAGAEVIRGFVEEILAVDPDAIVVNLGDMNEFYTRPAMTAMAGTVMTNLIDLVPANERYTYNFNGNAQNLDNVFLVNNHVAFAQAEILHVNTLRDDFRIATDHDPFLVTVRAGVQSLNIGDVVITGFNSDNPDQIAFTPMVNLPSFMEISFADYGWLASGGFRTGEGNVTWTGPGGGVSAGTVVMLEKDAGGTFWTTTHGSVEILDGSDLSLSTSGDQLFAFQGTVANPSLLFGIHFGGLIWEADATTSNTSALPAVLNVPGGNLAVDNVDNGMFIGSRTGLTFATYRTLIANPANWMTSSSFLTLDLSTFTE